MPKITSLNIQTWFVLIYSITITAFFFYSDQFNLGFSFFLAGSIIALAFSYQHRIEFLREWSVFLIIAVSYEGLRFLYLPLSEKLGIINVFYIDRALWGFNLTGTVQELSKSSILTPAMTLAYSLHIPLVIIFALTFWLGKRRNIFALYTTSIAICTYFSFLFFLTMPSAPPWWNGVAENLLSGGGVANTYHRLSDIFESDPLAAFPSLHAAYVLILTFVMFRISKKYALLFIFVAFAILFSTLYLGQHYLIDLVAGAFLAGCSFLLAKRLNQKVPLLKDASAAEWKIT